MCAEKWASAGSMATDVNRTHPIHRITYSIRQRNIYGYT